MNPDLASEIRSLSIGLRTFAGIFVLFVSYFNLRITLMIGNFGFIFRDMLGDKELPLLTGWIIQGRSFLLLLSLGLPLAALAVLWKVKNHQKALVIAAALAATSVVQAQLTFTGLINPLLSICTQLTGE